MRPILSKIDFYEVIAKGYVILRQGTEKGKKF